MVEERYIEYQLSKPIWLKDIEGYNQILGTVKGITWDDESNIVNKSRYHREMVSDLKGIYIRSPWPTEEELDEVRKQNPGFIVWGGYWMHFFGSESN